MIVIIALGAVVIGVLALTSIFLVVALDPDPAADPTEGGPAS